MDVNWSSARIYAHQKSVNANDYLLNLITVQLEIRHRDHLWKDSTKNGPSVQYIFICFGSVIIKNWERMQDMVTHGHISSLRISTVIRSIPF